MSFHYSEIRDARAKRDERKARLYKMVARRKTYQNLPTNAEIDEIPVSPCVEFELSEKETRTLRTRLYAINHDGLKRFRTLREGSLVIVWRIK